MCTSPKLIAAYHVFLRFLEPRHPPSALEYFTFDTDTILPILLALILKEHLLSLQRRSIDFIYRLICSGNGGG